MRAGRLRYRNAAGVSPGSVIEPTAGGPVLGGGSSTAAATSGRPGLMLLALLVLGLGAFAYWTK